MFTQFNERVHSCQGVALFELTERVFLLEKVLRDWDQSSRWRIKDVHFHQRVWPAQDKFRFRMEPFLTFIRESFEIFLFHFRTFWMSGSNWTNYTLFAQNYNSKLIKIEAILINWRNSFYCLFGVWLSVFLIKTNDINRAFQETEKLWFFFRQKLKKGCANNIVLLSF